MDKLELELDDLEVDSFETNTGQEEGQETVQGYYTGESCPCASDPWCAPTHDCDTTDCL